MSALQNKSLVWNTENLSGKNTDEAFILKSIKDAKQTVLIWVIIFVPGVKIHTDSLKTFSSHQQDEESDLWIFLQTHLSETHLSEEFSSNPDTLNMNVS